MTDDGVIEPVVPVPSAARGAGDGLVVTGLEKAYGATRALAGVSLEAAAGEIHALLGENGAGKSTLIKVLGGVVAPDAGEVRLGGRPVRLGSPRAAREAGIRTVFQELSLVGDLSVAESLVLEDLPRGRAGLVPRRRLRAAAEAAISEAGLGRLDVRRPVRELSLPQRQQLEIVKALRRPPRVLILDEATSALGPEESRWALAHARRLADAGVVVVMISHRIAEVREHADRMTILRGGKSVGAGPPDELSDDALIEAMLGRRVARLYPRLDPPRDEVVLRARGLWAGTTAGPLDLDVRAGEIVGVGGLEGQGQRALMMALAGAEPWSGTLEIDGTACSYRSPRAAIARGVAFVPEDRQNEGLLLGHAIGSNIGLSSLRRHRGRLGLLDGRAELRAATAEAEAVGLDTARLRHAAGTLSGGNQQKVVLARTLLTRPRVLLLYDCTRGIDVGSKADIFEALAARAAEGMAAVFYSSDTAELVNLCHRVVVVRGGRVAGVLDGERATEEEILHLAVGTRGDVEEAA